MENYYSLLSQFRDTFKGQGFKDIPADHPLLRAIEDRLATTGQCFHINNMVQMKILYCTPSCCEFFGVKREEIDPEMYFERTHLDDRTLHATGRSRVLRAAHELYTKQEGKWFLSAVLKTRNQSGEYIDMLYQMFLCYTDDPLPSVFGIQVNSNVSELMKEVKGIHYYVGTDESVFRPPDLELLSMGPGLSDREFEIILAIAEGLDSEEIAEKLFLSVHTVNTHRRNILEKAGKRSTHELVIEFQEQGLV